MTNGSTATDTGIENGTILIAFAGAVVTDNKAALETTRRQICDTMDEAALVDAAGVAAFFDGLDRIADATGTPVDPESAEATTEMRSALGIDKFNEVKRALDDAI